MFDAFVIGAAVSRVSIESIESRAFFPHTQTHSVGQTNDTK